MKKLYALLIGLIAITNGWAQTKPVAPNNKSLLWRISGRQMNKPSYLFGTIHLICPQDYIWTPKMKQALQQSDAVCLEMKMDDPTVLMQIAAAFIDNNGKELKDYFTPEQYRRITAYAKDSLGMEMSMLQQMKPIALETMLSLSASTCDNPVSYEENIMKDAKQANKPVMGLEEPAEQMAVLETIPADTVIKEILQMLDSKSNKSEDEAEYRKLIIAYKNQDIPALYLLLKETKGLETNMNAFLDERNEKWIERMVDKMEQRSIFFAVGAGHLWGDHGVITLLRNAGYSVEPLK